MTSPPPPGHPGPPPGYGPADLAKPLYGADVGQAFVRFWKKYLVFSGRASQSEFWWWALISAGIAASVNSINSTVLGSYPVPPAPRPDLDVALMLRDQLGYQLRAYLGALVWSLLTSVGLVALGVRRLHDTNRTGWWCLVVLVPFVGWIILVLLWGQPSRPDGQRYDR